MKLKDKKSKRKKNKKNILISSIFFFNFFLFILFFPSVRRRQVQLSLKMVTEDDGDWSLVHSDGEMQVFRRDFEDNGIICDRCKMMAEFPGVTGRELCEYFYNPNEKLAWDSKKGRPAAMNEKKPIKMNEERKKKK